MQLYEKNMTEKNRIRNRIKFWGKEENEYEKIMIVKSELRSHYIHQISDEISYSPSYLKVQSANYLSLASGEYLSCHVGTFIRASRHDTCMAVRILRGSLNTN